jgi:hypothetical protein
MCHKLVARRVLYKLKFLSLLIILCHSHSKEIKGLIAGFIIVCTSLVVRGS